jgi:hypothetical protein
MGSVKVVLGLRADNGFRGSAKLKFFFIISASDLSRFTLIERPPEKPHGPFGPQNALNWKYVVEIFITASLRGAFA